MDDQERLPESEETRAPELSPAPDMDLSVPEAASAPAAEDDDSEWDLPIPRAVIPDEAWMPSDGADVDAALAAVASLSMVSDREADDLARDEQETAPERQERAASGRRIASPNGIALKRGSLASVIPALLLIVIGGGWTFVNTTGGQIDPLLMAGVALACFIFILFLGWLSFGRWPRGLLFFAVLIAATVGLVALTLRVPGLDLASAYPLLLAAPGLAVLLAALLGRPANTRLLILAVLLIAAAAVGIAFNAGMLPFELSGILPYLAPITGGVLVVLWLLGAVSRRRV
ncbi:MAG: hypothetical protein JNL42_03970 [Anaerolineae bacterium]|nr:hypothetical protein [Anaerolineae bacterium]